MSEHRYSVAEYHRFGQRRWFRANCSTCGWTSQKHVSEDDAINDGDGHVVAMAGAS